MVRALPHTTTVSAACLSVENLSQRVCLVRDRRPAESKKNSQRRLNDDNVVIKHTQGPLVPSQGL